MEKISNKKEEIEFVVLVNGQPKKRDDIANYKKQKERKQEKSAYKKALKSLTTTR